MLVCLGKKNLSKLDLVSSSFIGKENSCCYKMLSGYLCSSFLVGVITAERSNVLFGVLAATSEFKLEGKTDPFLSTDVIVFVAWGVEKQEIRLTVSCC